MIFLGDFVDRGPKILEALQIVRPMVEEGHALAVIGNSLAGIVVAPVAGWLIEAEADGALQVGDAAPARVNWLHSGDEIRLTPSGPTLVFNPATRTDRSILGSAVPLPTVDAGDVVVELDPVIEPTPLPSRGSTGQSEVRPTKLSIEFPGSVTALWMSALGIFAIAVVMLLFRPHYPTVSPSVAVEAKLPDPTPAVVVVPSAPPESNIIAPVAPAVVIPPAFSWDEIARTHEDAIVCVALEYKGYSFPYATGWVARANRIVTTASVVVELEAVIEKGLQIVVHHKRQVIPIQSVRRHPRYDAAQPTDRTSQRFNLGLLIPKTDLTSACVNATDEEWKSINLESQFLPLGVVSSLGENEPYDPLKVQTKRLSIRMTGSDTVPDVVVPLYKVVIELPKTAEGSPVFNNAGHVIGVLAPVGSSVTLVPTSELNALLD